MPSVRLLCFVILSQAGSAHSKLDNTHPHESTKWTILVFPFKFLFPISKIKICVDDIALNHMANVGVVHIRLYLIKRNASYIYWSRVSSKLYEIIMRTYVYVCVYMYSSCVVYR